MTSGWFVSVNICKKKTDGTQVSTHHHPDSPPFQSDVSAATFSCFDPLIYHEKKKNPHKHCKRFHNVLIPSPEQMYAVPKFKSFN